MMNARVDLKLKGDLAIFYLQADNLLDKKYADILGPQMPGRWISAGIRLQTGK
jgi:iron complex outermembrane receptor protein